MVAQPGFVGNPEDRFSRVAAQMRRVLVGGYRLMIREASMDLGNMDLTSS